MKTRTFGTLATGQRFALPQDPSVSVLVKTGPTSYRVDLSDDEFAVGLKIGGVNRNAVVFPLFGGEGHDEIARMIGDEKRDNT